MKIKATSLGDPRSVKSLKAKRKAATHKAKSRVDDLIKRLLRILCRSYLRPRML